MKQERFALFLIALPLLGGCGGKPQLDDSEIPPTPVLGSGARLFEFASGAIVCQQTTYNLHLISCQALVRDLSAPTGFIIDSDAVATGFASDIIFTQWQPLQVSWIDGDTSVPVFSVDSNGTHAMYRLPDTAPTGTELTLVSQLLVETNTAQRMSTTTLLLTLPQGIVMTPF